MDAGGRKHGPAQQHRWHPDRGDGKDYGEVLRRAQSMIESAPDGSGGWRDPNNHAPISVPIWLPRGRRSGSGHNWYDNPAHPGTLVFPEVWQHPKTYPFGGTEERYNGSALSAVKG